jgi:hypothetical protein
VQSFTGVPKLGFVLGMLAVISGVGCGGSSPVVVHTTGNFSNASLTGSYVYQIHGAASNGALYRQVGVFTADGNGNITGTDDSSINASGTAIAGTYTVASDGTGFITFTNSSLGSGIQLAITLVSSSTVDLIENDPSLNAAGTAVQQDTTATATTPSGTFVFGLHQEQAAQNVNTEASQVGAFALSSGIGTGAIDQNLGGTFSSLTLSATFNAPGAGGRGTGTFLDSTSFTTDFVYYIVNSGRLALLVTNTNAVGSGTAEVQSGAVSGGLSGSYAFGSRGDDSFLYGLATVGQFTASSGTITGNEDAMVDGTYTANSAFSACYTTGAVGGINGRVAVILNGSGACSGTPSQVFWMVSPSRAYFIDINLTQFQDGTADLQTTSSFSTSTFNGQFALVMDGLDRTPEEEGEGDLLLGRVGALQFNGSGTSDLTELVNEFSGGSNPGGLTGPYSVSSNGRTTVQLANGGGPLDLVMYAISGSQAYVMQADGGLVTSGTAQQQQ